MTPRWSAGLCALDVDGGGARVPAWAMYPASAPERAERIGPYEFSAAAGADPEGRELPVVVVSHGNGGSPWTHRGVASRLARAGFVVLLLEHPGNSRSSNGLAGTLANLEARPRHVRRALDALYGEAGLGPRLAPSRAGVLGHSIGAYTALAVAGGEPTCFAHEAPDGARRRVDVERDRRVRALALLAPAVAWYFEPGALAGVDAAIFGRAGERDEITPPAHAEVVARGVARPERVDYRVVPGAGHFSFQSPFPPAMCRPDFAPSLDPEGFDRATYQQALEAELEEFFRRELAGAEV